MSRPLLINVLFSPNESHGFWQKVLVKRLLLVMCVLQLDYYDRDGYLPNRKSSSCQLLSFKRYSLGLVTYSSL